MSKTIKSTRGTWKTYGHLPTKTRNGRSKVGWLDGYASGLVFTHAPSDSALFGVKSIAKEKNRLGKYQIDHIPTGAKLAVTPRQATARHIVQFLMNENVNQWLFTDRDLSRNATSRKHRDQLQLSLERARDYAWARDNGVYS